MGSAPTSAGSSRRPESSRPDLHAVPDPPPLRVAVIGYGLAGRVFHAPLVDTTPGLAVTAIATSDPDRRRQAAADHPGVALPASPDELWSADPAPELIVVATPNDTHAPLAGAAVQRGIPVVVDKPLALDPPSAEALIEAAESSGTLLTVFQNRRWDSDYLTLAQLLRDGTLGHVLRFESRFERWRPGPIAPGWRNEADPAHGGGVLADLGSHLIDQALVLFGPVAHVYAELGHRKAGPADDDAFVALTHTGGTISHLHASALAAAPGPRLRVLGTEGGFVAPGLDSQEDALRAGERPRAGARWGVEPDHNRGRLVAGDQSIPLPSVGAWPTFYRELERALRTGGPPPVEPRDALATLRVIEAARASAETGRLVSPR